MAAASARGSFAPSGSLSIGQVIARLAPEFPKLTASKLRFLEDQGIVSPTRTESGYRKFDASDVERVRLALQLQRDQYLPLSVIKQHLDDRDAARATGQQAPQAPASIHPRGRRYRKDELIQTAGATPRLFAQAVSAGLIAQAETYGTSTLTVLRAVVDLDRHGIDPRHVRAVRQAAERDVALVEAALVPLVRRGDAAGRSQAGELAPELVRRLEEIREVFLRSALSRLTP